MLGFSDVGAHLLTVRPSPQEAQGLQTGSDEVQTLKISK